MRPLALLALLVLPACTHTRTARSAADYADLGRRVEGRRVVVALADGRRLPAEGLRLSPDSASWVDPETRSLHRAATADVAAVTLGRRRGRGALEGLAIGTGAGALGGAALGYATYDDGGDSGSFGCFIICSRGEAAGWLGSVFGLAGGLAGTAVGAIRGSPVVYRLASPAPPPSRDVPAAPPASASE